MRPFRERNPLVVGAVGLAVIAALIAVAFSFGRVPFLGGDDAYVAHFSEAAGLREGEEVRLAGIRVGQVRAVELEGDHVRVEFVVDSGTRLGDRTSAEIKIKTILGAHFLSLSPNGPGRLEPGDVIPTSRTTEPFNVIPAVEQLTKEIQAIDVKQLARSMDTLSSTFKDSPPEVRAALSGLTRISKTISSRDDQLRELMEHSKNITGTLADRDRDFTLLLRDGDALLKEVQARRNMIHQLLLNTVMLAQQITALVEENNAALKPALADLKGVVKVLERNTDSLDRSLRLMGPFVRQFTDATGSGNWFDSYVQNLLPVPPAIVQQQENRVERQEILSTRPLLEDLLAPKGETTSGGGR
ncbi:MAG: MCE family protein [Streptosporangiales bacterium]|nr:MCE family protein [Streptosporangiales bacterium]